MIKLPDLEKNQGKVLLITAVRVLFYSAILLITVLYQLKQALFFNTESIFPLYTLLITAFLLNTLFLLFFNKAQKIWQATTFLFLYDTFFVTSLIYVTGVQNSIFLFLYLVNIILCGFIFQRKGAFLLALFTSSCFSFLLVFSPQIQGQTLYYAVGLNNIAFFAVAYLSGYLSEVLNFMGSEISTQKQDIKALKDLNKIIVENISSGLITLSQDYRIILFNQAAQRILGVNKSITGDNIDKYFNGMSEIIRLNSFEARLEMRYETPKAEKLILGFSITPLKNNDELNGYILIFQDLTEIIRLESAMRRQDKLAAVGKLAAGIAHEIRNPLASISGSIELLKTTLDIKSPEDKKLMEIMLREISRLNSLITEFLDFVRPDEKKMEVCDIDSILKEVLEVVKLNQSLPQNIKQSVSLNSHSFIQGDKNKLKQVFLNLFINSYQAMQENSQGGVLQISSELKNSQVIVKIKDSGHGMSETTQRRLFEPFFTTKKKGTGLGLATAHKILETHDARIFVESHEGIGTEFTITFNYIIKEGAKANESQNTGS
ncbi:MAG: PAS domain-containing protein [Oligoflexia bacterium]|nr:PAS domain-containing protein [Oligoflexia bacterium]